MKVGDYVRLKNGYIDKIEELKLQTKYTKYNELLFEHKAVECLFSDEELKRIKSSPNIIDLIEENDFINGLRVEKNKYGELYTSYVYYGGDIGKQYEVYTTWLKEYTEDMIENIVTHEQFERMQYNLESEVN